MIAFVKDYYGPIAAKHGTLCEKRDDTSSLAHGWSVGVASLVVDAD